MHRYLVAAVATAGLLLGAAGAAHAQSNDGKNRWMKVNNYSNQTAIGIFIKPAGTDWSWSRDLLGANVVSPGRAFDVNFDDGSGACVFDIHVTGRPWSFRRNVCVDGRLDLY